MYAYYYLCSAHGCYGHCKHLLALQVLFTCCQMSCCCETFMWTNKWWQIIIIKKQCYILCNCDYANRGQHVPWTVSRRGWPVCQYHQKNIGQSCSVVTPQTKHVLLIIIIYLPIKTYNQSKSKTRELAAGQQGKALTSALDKTN